MYEMAESGLMVNGTRGVRRCRIFISPLCVLVVELVYLSSARCLWKGDKIFVLTFDVPFLLSPFIPWFAHSLSLFSIDQAPPLKWCESGIGVVGGFSVLVADCLFESFVVSSGHEGGSVVVLVACDAFPIPAPQTGWFVWFIDCFGCCCCPCSCCLELESQLKGSEKLMACRQIFWIISESGRWCSCPHGNGFSPAGTIPRHFPQIKFWRWHKWPGLVIIRCLYHCPPQGISARGHQRPGPSAPGATSAPRAAPAPQGRLHAWGRVRFGPVPSLHGRARCAAGWVLMGNNCVG